MPTETVWIKSVQARRVFPTLTRYVVFASHDQGAIWSRELFTASALKASLCKESIDRFPVVIGSRETKWGFEIITIEKAVDPVTTEGAA